MMHFLLTATDYERSRLLGRGLGQLVFTIALLVIAFKGLRALIAAAHRRPNDAPVHVDDTRPGPPRFNG